MNTASWVMWSIGLLLQIVLLVLLMRRGIFKQVPVFSVLIAFYLIRAGLLFVLGRTSHEPHQELYSALSVADLVLQFLVTVEIVAYILRKSSAGSPDNRLRSAALIVVGLAAALCITALVPLHGPVPLDRGLIVITVIALLLAIWTRIAGLAGFPRSIAEGFSVYGIIGIIAGIVHNYAFLHRSGPWYVAASYAQSGVYICVVLFWIVVLAAGDRAVPHSRTKSKKKLA